MVAELMALSARTAPKARGTDSIVIKIISGDDLRKLAGEMRRLGELLNLKPLLRDSGNMDQSDACVVIGCKGADVAGIDCGGCGFATCKEMEAAPKTDGEFKGPQCAFRHLDMGIALGSAVKTAGILNADNRIMYRIGAAARSMGICDWDYVMGVPLSAKGKSIYFDR